LFSQLVAGTLTDVSATAAINPAVATEQTALNNLAATPGKIIATDVAAIQKLAGNVGASAATALASATNTLQPSASNVLASNAVGQKAARDATAACRHAARP
jgi:hypothetical protein